MFERSQNVTVILSLTLSNETVQYNHSCLGIHQELSIATLESWLPQFILLVQQRPGKYGRTVYTGTVLS